ncbi:MAG: hypothetical protein WCP60_04770 [bacterium]
MNDFPLPQEPTPKQSAFENGVIRWVTLLLPVVIVGKILGLLAIAAILISINFNILGWIE